MKIGGKLLSAVLALVMMFGCLAGCKSGAPAPAKTAYTYHGATTALGTNWNPHTWETNADDLSEYLETPLATRSILDSEKGIYQWVFKAATSVTDVTKDHKDDLTRYRVTLPEGQSAEQTEKGYVFEIRLNPDMRWQNGTVINADTYIYSMKALLDPAMRNYRANLYYYGESAVAGGSTYYNSGAPIYDPMVPVYGAGEAADYSYDLERGIREGRVYISTSAEGMTLNAASLAALNSKNKLGLDGEVNALSDSANPYGYTQVTPENFSTVKTLVNGVLAGAFGITDAAAQADMLKEALWVFDGRYSERVGYDETVGCYKVDDFTIRYVTQAQIDYNYFLTSCASNWLVYEEFYEKGKDTTGTLVTTDYGTKVENTMSYGPFKLDSLQPEKQMVFSQNEYYYEYKKNADDTLSAATDYFVDGKYVESWKTTRVVIDVMTPEAAKQAFLKGQLTVWTPPADEVSNYTTSQQMYKVDETYTMSLFFNTNEAALKEMDRSKGNRNSVVLTNYNFRKAMSLAIDRADWVTATEGYKPAYALMNNLYFYDIYNDPNSSYRGSKEAMQAIAELYGVDYGEGTAYPTLEAAYASISGYNLTEAKRLMQIACDELAAAGLYKPGEEIRIRVGFAKGPMTSSEQNQLSKLQQYIGAAMEGSGFGRITLEGVGNIPDRYGDVPRGEYAIGYGAWGGAAFYPFRNMQVYCDPDANKVNELGAWDPTTETLTIPISGENITMTWQDWSNALVGTGPYANADFATKLSVTATMEKEFLNKYYRIPLAGTSEASLLSYQVNYYTENYNIMYGFGGLELMQYNYTDAQWADYVRDAGGTLRYE